MGEELKRRQEAGVRVEAKMMETLLNLTATEELKVRDVQFIARMARQCAFEEFSRGVE